MARAVCGGGMKLSNPQKMVNIKPRLRIPLPVRRFG